MYNSFIYLLENIILSSIKELEFYKKKNLSNNNAWGKFLCINANILLFLMLLFVNMHKRYKKIFTTSTAFYGVVTIFVSIMIAVFGYSYCNSSADISKVIPSFVNTFYANIASELIGIAITVLLIDKINGNRLEQHTLDDIVARTRSRINRMALEAVEELRIHGWLYNSSLSNKILNGNLESADFEGAELSNADFSRATLIKANFKESLCEHTVFACSNLEESNFASAKLPYIEAMGANFFKTDFSKSNAHRGNFFKANLSSANLYDVEWIGADLCGANLSNANLLNANLKDSIFDEHTVMPDNIKYYQGMNLNKYTQSES